MPDTSGACPVQAPITNIYKTNFLRQKKAHNGEQMPLLSYITAANSRHQSVIQKIINNR